MNQLNVIKDNIDKSTINNEVIEILTTCRDNFRIPGQVKKYLSEAISLLNYNEKGKISCAFEKIYTWKDKAIKICKDVGEDNYYFVCYDTKNLSINGCVSYHYPLEFDNEEGMWDSYEECLNEVKDTANNFWDNFVFVDDKSNIDNVIDINKTLNYKDKLLKK